MVFVSKSKTNALRRARCAPQANPSEAAGLDFGHARQSPKPVPFAIVRAVARLNESARVLRFNISVIFRAVIPIFSQGPLDAFFSAKRSIRSMDL